MPTYDFLSWFSLNVHLSEIDVTLPGEKKDGVYSRSIALLKRSAAHPTLPVIVDRWAQFLVHEKLSSGSGGVAEIYLDGKRVVSMRGRPTVRAGRINFHFQYGYYRAKDPVSGSASIGTADYTPVLIKRGVSSGDVPALP